jgi:hypothetical protein
MGPPAVNRSNRQVIIPRRVRSDSLMEFIGKAVADTGVITQ